MARPFTPPEPRFWVKVDAFGDCWDYTGAVTSNGYGNFAVRPGRCVGAHRYAWETLVGPIPTGMVLDHLCRNRRCVNPDHLQVVTNRENLLRGQTFVGQNLNKTACPQGHPYDATNTYVTKVGHRSCRECKRAYDRRKDAEKRARVAADMATTDDLDALDALTLLLQWDHDSEVA